MLIRPGRDNEQGRRDGTIPEPAGSTRPTAAAPPTQSGYGLAKSSNLRGRRFGAERPDRIWLIGVTYVPTGEGWL